VNPFDIDGTASAAYRALTLDVEERRSRMRGLRQRVFRNTVQRWAQRFLAALEASEPSAAGRSSAPQELAQRVGDGPLVLLLDYDGTLVPFTTAPDLAKPDAELLALLGALAQRPRTPVHVGSGRRRDTLEHWLGALPIGLHAEHGLWSRPVGGAWKSATFPAGEWRDRARELLAEVAANTPGSLVEEKTLGLAFHYRGADPQYGPRQANALRVNLTELLANAPVEVLTGAKVIELRPHGLHKGLVVERALQDARTDARVVALGDDRTDEDLFAALPEGALAIHVGPTQSRAPWRLASVETARAFLRHLLEPSQPA